MCEDCYLYNHTPKPACQTCGKEYTKGRASYGTEFRGGAKVVTCRVCYKLLEGTRVLMELDLKDG